MGRTLFLIGCLFAFQASGLAQPARISFEARADAETITIDDYLTVEFTLINARGSEFQPPDFQGFLIQSGPNTSIRQTSLNGRVSSEFSYRYTLLPERIGELTIGPASIRSNQKTYRSDPVTVRVVEARTEGGAPELLLEMKPSRKTVWLGQQLNLDYNLLFQKRVKDYNIVREPDFPDQSVHDLQRFNSRAIREVRNGTSYARQTLRRKALFPQRSGLIIVDSLLVQVGIQEKDGLNNLFSIAPLRYRLLRSDTVQVEVKSLPPDLPTGFMGAVGHFEAKLSVDSEILSLGEALELTVAVQGDGDIKRVFAPALDLPDGWEAYEKKVIEEKSFDLNGKLLGRKVFRYTLLPTQAGKVEWVPELHFFDVDSARYRLLTRDTFRVHVKSSTSTESAAREDDRAHPGEDLPLKLDTGLERPSGKFAGTSLFWLWVFSPFILAALVIARALWQKQRGEKVAVMSDAKAEKRFRRALDSADLQSPEAPTYLSANWLLLLQRLTRLPETARKPAILAALEERAFDPQKISKAKTIWKKLDQARFAGTASGIDLNELVREMKEWIAH
jgi:hypothetical protein